MIAKKIMWTIVMMLSAVAHIDAADEQGALHIRLRSAIQAGASLVTITMLVDRITDVNAYGGSGRTLCHIVVVWDREDVIEILFKKGANVNAKDVDGDTPLHEACSHEASSAVEALLRCGANTQEKNKAGQTPLDIARMRHNKAIVRCIEDYESIPDVKEPESD